MGKKLNNIYFILHVEPPYMEYGGGIIAMFPSVHAFYIYCKRAPNFFFSFDETLFEGWASYNNFFLYMIKRYQSCITYS